MKALYWRAVINGLVAVPVMVGLMLRASKKRSHGAIHLRPKNALVWLAGHWGDDGGCADGGGALFDRVDDVLELDQLRQNSLRQSLGRGDSGVCILGLETIVASYRNISEAPRLVRK